MKAHMLKVKSIFPNLVVRGTDTLQCSHCKKSSSCDRLQCNYTPKHPGNSKGKIKTKRGRGE